MSTSNNLHTLTTAEIARRLVALDEEIAAYSEAMLCADVCDWPNYMMERSEARRERAVLAEVYALRCGRCPDPEGA